MSEASNNTRCCAVCGKKEGEEGNDNDGVTLKKLKKCTSCRSVFYCSVDCQKKHWPSHRNSCTKLGVLALMKAVQNKDDDDDAIGTIKQLAKVKRVVNGKINYKPDDPANSRVLGKWTPLHECIRRHNADALQLLIDGGVANLEIKDIDGESLVYVASTNKYTDCLKVLLKAGANPNAVAGDGFSAIMDATRSSYYEHVKLLLEAGASLYVGSDMFGRGALEIAELGSALYMNPGESMEDATKRKTKTCQLLYEYKNKN